MPPPPVLTLLSDYLNRARGLQPSQTSSKKSGKKSPPQKPTTNNERKSKAGTSISEELRPQKQERQAPQSRTRSRT
jgi:hypothetical protein